MHAIIDRQRHIERRVEIWLSGEEPYEMLRRLSSDAEFSWLVG